MTRLAIHMDPKFDDLLGHFSVALRLSTNISVEVLSGIVSRKISIFCKGGLYAVQCVCHFKLGDASSGKYFSWRTASDANFPETFPSGNFSEIPK